MAQNYEIDIKRFNGQDYDTLLPTPASHASTHQADGSDPITLQEGNYGDSSIPTSAYQDSSVTRKKLAQDALYSPIAGVGGVGTIYITSADIGKTLKGNWNKAMTLIITQENSAKIPYGAEFAAFRWGNSEAQECKIIADGTRLAFTGDGTFYKNGTAKISEVFGMIALKKVTSDQNQGDAWLITGNVEVVS